MPSARVRSPGFSVALAAVVCIVACDSGRPVMPEEVGPPLLLSDTATTADPTVNVSAVLDPPVSSLTAASAPATNVTFVSLPARRLSTGWATYQYHTDPSWSPNSRTIAFTRQYCDYDDCEAPSVWLVDLQGTQLSQVTSNGASPVWKP